MTAAISAVTRERLRRFMRIMRIAAVIGAGFGAVNAGAIAAPGAHSLLVSLLISIPIGVIDALLTGSWIAASTTASSRTTAACGIGPCRAPASAHPRRVDLGFFAGGELRAVELFRLARAKPAHEPLDAVVGAVESELVDQILVDRGGLRRSPDLGLDERTVGLARRDRHFHLSRWPGRGKFAGLGHFSGRSLPSSHAAPAPAAGQDLRGHTSAA